MLRTGARLRCNSTMTENPKAKLGNNGIRGNLFTAATARMHREPGKEAPAQLAGVSCCGCSACLLTLNPLKLEKEEAAAVVSFNDCPAEPPTAATQNPPPNPIPCTTACAIPKTLPHHASSTLQNPNPQNPTQANKTHSQSTEPEPPTLCTLLPPLQRAPDPGRTGGKKGTTTHFYSCLQLLPMRGRHQSVSPFLSLPLAGGCVMLASSRCRDGWCM